MGTAVCYLRKYKDYHRSSLSPEKAPYCLPAIVYLACKTNEELRTIRDIFNACFVVRHRDYDVAEMDSVSRPTQTTWSAYVTSNFSDVRFHQRQDHPLRA